jgi:hypothetical protein
MEKKLSPSISLILECCKIDRNEVIIKSQIGKIGSWEEFISLSFSQGVFPLVYNTLKNYSEIISEDNLQTMKLKNLNIVKQNMFMTSELLRVLKILEENNILAIPFKGPVLSQMVYGDVVSRQYLDLDILIENKDLDIVIGILNELNYESKLNYNISKEKIKELVSDHLFFNLKSFISLEIHNKLFSINFPIKLNNADYLANRSIISINNNLINTFSKEYLLVYLCLHGTKHLYSRLSWLIDIDRMINNYDLDWKVIEKLVKDTNSKTMVYFSFFFSEYLFDTKLPFFIKNEKNFKYSFLINRVMNTKVDDEIDNRFSYIHFLMFDNIKQKIMYLFYILRPTFLDYQCITKEYKYDFIYYCIRPFNILFRFLRK